MSSSPTSSPPGRAGQPGPGPSQAARTLRGIGGLGELLDLFIGEVADQLDADRASLMLLDPDSGELRIVASRGVDDVRPDDVSLPLGQGVAGSVAVSGRARLARDEQDGGRSLRADAAASYVSAPVALSFPVKTGGSVIGVINVTNRRDGHRFDVADLARLEGLARELALALERAHHVEELERAYRTLRSTEARLISLERMHGLGADDQAAALPHVDDMLSVVTTRTQLALLHLAGGSPDVGSATEQLRGVEAVLARTAALRGGVRPVAVIGGDGPKRSPARILLIEDDELVRHTFSDALSFEGHVVTQVASAPRALAALDRASFDVVITDLSMPGMSGLELARRVKERDDAPPVILVSGWVLCAEQVADAGVDRVVGKPCAIEELLGAVDAVHETGPAAVRT